MPDRCPEKARKRAGNDAACALRKLSAWADDLQRADVAQALRDAAATVADCVETLRDASRARAIFDKLSEQLERNRAKGA